MEDLDYYIDEFFSLVDLEEIYVDEKSYLTYFQNENGKLNLTFEFLTTNSKFYGIQQREKALDRMFGVERALLDFNNWIPICSYESLIEIDKTLQMSGGNTVKGPFLRLRRK